MSDSERSSHWQFLAELLGAKPKSEPEQAPVSEKPESEASATTGGDASLSEKPTPPSRERAKRATKPSAAPSSPHRHWGDVARSLGLDVPAIPEEEEIEEVPEPSVETVAEPKGEPAPRARREPSREEPRSGELVRHVPHDLPDVTSGASPRDNFLEEIGLADDTFEAIDQEAAEIERDAEQAPPADESSRSGSRRRRRGRHRRRREEGTASEAATDDADLEPPTRSDREGAERGEPMPPDRIEEVEAEERPAEPRRRRRRRGGERRPSESRAEDQPMRGVPESAGRGPSRPSRERPHERPSVEASDYDEMEGEGDDDASERRSRRSVPSWSEAVQDIVNQNLAARQKSRRPRGGRGRRPNHRDR